MKVKQVRKMLSKVVQILEVYENYTLDDMLDDIISKVVTNNEIKEQSKVKEKLNADFNSIKEKILRSNSTEEVVEELIKLDKNTLINFGKFVEVRVDKSDSKFSIARVIAGHINFSNLNEQISQRNKAITQEKPSNQN